MTSQYLKQDIAKEGHCIDVVNGQVSVPTGAGLGIEVDESALAGMTRKV